MKKKGKKKNIFFKVSFFVFIVYVAFTLVDLRLQINEKAQYAGDLNAQIEEQVCINEQLKALLDTEDDLEYAAQIAREKLDYSLPGDRVFMSADE